MKLIMRSGSQEFLADNVPEALDASTLEEALDQLYEFIAEEGFEPPEYEWYNDIGKQAQKVYDDLYYSNKQFT